MRASSTSASSRITECNAGQEFEHPTSQLTATTFVPRRVLYELRAGRDYFKAKERCVFCDIISQELQQNQRVLEVRGDFIAFCPYAPRVPYETWIIPRTHEAAFERFGLARPGSCSIWRALLRRTLQRIRTVTGNFTWCCTLRPIPCTDRRAWTTGRPSTTTITGTLKSCR